MDFHRQSIYFIIMKTRYLFLTFLILTAPSIAVFAQGPAVFQTLTVNDAVQIALEKNLSLMQNAIDLGTKKRTLDHSWNSLLPTLSASAMISHPTSLTGPIEPESRNVWTPGFSFSAGLTLSATVIENIKKAKADYQTGLLSYEAARQELELSVRKLFYQMLLLDANRELAVQNFQSAQARHEQTVVLNRIGQAPVLDELSARVDMENIRPTVINAEMLYENAMDSFKTILGIPAETTIKLEGNFTGEITGDISSANTGSGDSLEALRLLQSIRSMEAQRNAVRNNAYIPSLRLSWSSNPAYNIQNEVWNDSGSFSVSLGFNVDNFLPWSGAKTQIDTLDDNIRAAIIQLTEITRNRDNRINQNIRTVLKISESLDAINLNIELAQSTYDIYEESYKRGAADYQRLRNASDSIAQAKNRLLQEQYNLVSTLLDLEKELNIPFGTLFESSGSNEKK